MGKLSWDGDVLPGGHVEHSLGNLRLPAVLGTRPRCVSFISPGGMTGGASAIGALAGTTKYILCKTKCPKSTSTGYKFLDIVSEGFKTGMNMVGSVAGATGALFGLEQDVPKYGRDDNGNPYPDEKLLKDIRHRGCIANCKVDSLLMAAGFTLGASSLMAGMAAPIDEWTAGPSFAFMSRANETFGVVGLGAPARSGDVEDDVQGSARRESKDHAAVARPLLRRVALMDFLDLRGDSCAAYPLTL